MTTAIRGATVLMEDGPAEADLVIADGLIAAIGTAEPAEREIDGRGLVLAPAMVDLHGDAFERQVMPRPGVAFPADPAILDTDRQLAANGIATAYHAVTLSWEPGLRSVEGAAAFLAALEAARSRLTVENRVQLRWETFAFEAVPVIEQALTADLLPAIAFNDHTSIMLRDFGTPLQERAFEHGPDFRAAHFDDPRLAGRVEGSARRAGISADEYLYRLRQIWDRRDEVEPMIRRVAAAGRSVRAPMLSHDDAQVHVTGETEKPCLARTPATLAMAEEARRIARGLGHDLAETSSGGGSDGNFTSAAGVPTLDGLGAVGNHWHSPGEHVLVAPLARRAALLRGLILGFAARRPLGDTE